VTEVVILSSISEHAHACQASTELGVEAYSEYAALLKGDVQDSRAYSQQLAGRQAGQQPSSAAVDVRVSVRHVPMHLCVVEDHSFVLPARSAPAAMARLVTVTNILQVLVCQKKHDMTSIVCDASLLSLLRSTATWAARVGLCTLV
jgi:hypothetical protein